MVFDLICALVTGLSLGYTICLLLWQSMHTHDKAEIERLKNENFCLKEKLQESEEENGKS